MWAANWSNQLSNLELQSLNHRKQSELFNDTFIEMAKFKRYYPGLYKIHEDISSLCFPSNLVTDLEGNIESIEKAWKELAEKIKQQITLFCQIVSLEATLPEEIMLQLRNR